MRAPSRANAVFFLMIFVGSAAAGCHAFVALFGASQSLGRQFVLWVVIVSSLQACGVVVLRLRLDACSALEYASKFATSG
jgi:hypothetical protein